MASASAQNVSVIGTVTPGNCAAFNSTTVIKDAGFTCTAGSGNVVGPGSSTNNGLPLWANTTGTLLKDGAGQTIAGAYTWSGAQTYSSTQTANGLVNFTSTFQIAGSTITWQAGAGTVPFLGASQTWTGANTFAPGNTSVNGNLFTNGGGLQLGSPTGGDKGAGTLNAASGLFINGAAVGGTVSGVTCNGLTFTTSGNCPPTYGFQNCSIAASVASNNLTIALKDNAGADPSAASPCNVYYRNLTQATGSWSQQATTTATSFTVNSGSTFGSTNTTATCRAAAACPFKLWVVLINAGGSNALGVVDLTNASGVDPINEGTVLTTTACSACITANTIGTVYSTAAQTSRPFVILGYLEWGSGLVTAGTWASGPTSIQTLGPGIHKPGDVIQSQVCCVGSVTTVGATGATFGAGSNTNVTASISLTMSSNPVRMHWSVTGQHGTAAIGHCQMSDNSGPTAVGNTAAVTTPTGGANWPWSMTGGGYDTPGVTTSKTYVVRCYTAAGTLTVPAAAADGGDEIIEEIMG
jgi:hypothetical protein